jgi:signal transduction histidine kinase
MTSQPQPSTAPDHPADASFEHLWERFGVFWNVVFYVGIAFAIYNVVVTRPDLLRGWRVVFLGALLAAFCALYQWSYLQPPWIWPMPARQALAYFPAQITLLLVLTLYNHDFGWMAWAIIAQMATKLPFRQWPLPTLASLAIFTMSFDLQDEIQRGDWVAPLSLVFNSLIFLALFASMYLAFRQRFQLSEVVCELRAAKQKLEQQAAHHEELVVLRERTRLAREMHDSIGHALVAVNVKLEAAQRLYAVNPTRGDRELEATRALVRETMAELRRSLMNLRAPLPTHQDLPVALQGLAEELRGRSALQVSCHTISDVPALAPAAAEALWRVVREALANVERHAAAASVSISLDRRSDSIVLCIDDDGVGVTPAALARPTHYGVIGMRERVEALGGSFAIHARSGGGTTVEARLPIAAEDRSGAAALAAQRRSA